MNFTFNTLRKMLGRKTADMINVVKPYTQDADGNYVFDAPLPYEDLPEDVKDRVIYNYSDINTEENWWSENLDEWFTESRLTPAGILGTSHGWEEDRCAWDFNVDDYGAFAKSLWTAMGKQTVREWPAARATLRALLEGQISVSWRHNSTRGAGTTYVEDMGELAVHYPRTRVDWPAALTFLDNACEEYFQNLESSFMQTVHAEYEHQQSREAIEDTIEANEYMFDERGHIATLALRFPKQSDMVGILNTMDSGVRDIQAFIAHVHPWQIWRIENPKYEERGPYLFIVRAAYQQSVHIGQRRRQSDPPDTGVTFEHAFWSRSIDDREYIREWHREGADVGATLWASELPARLIMTDWRPLLVDQTPPLTTEADMINVEQDVLSTGLQAGDTVEALDSGNTWIIRAVGTWAQLVAAGLPPRVHPLYADKFVHAVEPLYWAVTTVGVTGGGAVHGVGYIERAMLAIREGKRAAYRTVNERQTALREARERAAAHTARVLAREAHVRRLDLTFNKMSSILHAGKAIANDNHYENSGVDTQNSRSQRRSQSRAIGMAQGVQNTACQTARQTQVGSMLTFADALALPLAIDYPTVDDLIQTNADIMAEEGRPPQLWADTPQRLEAAIGRMQSGFGDYEAFPTLIEKAAVLIHSMITGHVFVDGCKRSAIEAAMDFLNINGVTDAVVDKYFGIGDAGLEELTVKIAMNEMSHAQLVEWFHQQHQPPTATSTTSGLRFTLADMINVGQRRVGDWVRVDKSYATARWLIVAIGPKSKILPRIPADAGGIDGVRRLSGRTPIVWLTTGQHVHCVTLRELESDKWLPLSEWYAKYEPQRTAGLRFADMINVVQNDGTYTWQEMLAALAPWQLWRRLKASTLGDESLLYVFDPRIVERDRSPRLGQGVGIYGIWLNEWNAPPEHGVTCWVWEREAPYILVSSDWRTLHQTADMINVVEDAQSLRLPDRGVKYNPTLMALRELRQQFGEDMPARSWLMVGDVKYADDTMWKRFPASVFVRDAQQSVEYNDADAVLVFCFFGTDHYGGNSVIFRLDDFWAMTRGIRIRASRSAAADMINAPDVRAGNPRKIRVSYSTTTPESIEAGEDPEWGWEDEEGQDIELDMADMDDDEYQTVEQYLAARTVAILRQMGAVERANDTDYYGESYTEDYHTGARKELCYHLTNFTDDELGLVATYWDRANRRHAGLTFVSANSDIAEDSIVSGQPVETSPSDEQIESGNYQKGHVRLHGLDITVENPKGSTRRGTDADGREWEQKLHSDYGYIRGSTGKDGDSVDVFVGEHHDSEFVYVVNQKKKGGQGFDEHKVVLGTHNEDDAQAEYLSNYEAGWLGGQGGSLDGVAMTIQQFRDWLAEGETTRRVTLKCVRETMRTSADMINIPVEGPWIDIEEAVRMMHAWQLWEIQDPRAVGGYTFLHVVDPHMHMSQGDQRRLRRGQWAMTPHRVDDFTGVARPTVAAGLGNVRLVAGDFRTYQHPPETQQRTADMVDVLMRPDFHRWTKYIGKPHTFAFKRYPTSISMEIVNFIREHISPELSTLMIEHGCSTAFEVMAGAHIRIIGADVETAELTFSVAAPWDPTLVLMAIDVPIADAEMQLFLAPPLAPPLVREATMPQPVRDSLDYPNFAAVAAQLTAVEEQALREIVERAGAVFNGVQDYGQHGHFVFFTERQTGSTAILPVQDVTDERMAEKLRTVRERFNV